MPNSHSWHTAVVGFQWKQLVSSHAIGQAVLGDSVCLMPEVGQWPEAKQGAYEQREIPKEMGILSGLGSSLQGSSHFLPTVTGGRKILEAI